MRPARSQILSECAGIRHGFFGREGGVSCGIYASLNCGAGSRDAPTNVAENKRRVQAFLGAQQLITLSQVHSSHVIVMKQGDDIRSGEADAMVTSLPHLALGILTADCGPVLFADAKAGVIGAAHAGWKGATGGVLENTVKAMESLGARRERIAAALGPTIAQASYEVGAEFKELFSKDVQATFFKGDYFDLPAYITARLEQMGLAKVDNLAIDTYANEQDYFSYRRKTHLAQPDYGRQISCIMIEENI